MGPVPRPRRGLREYFDGNYQGKDLPRLRAELVNIDAIIEQSLAATSTGEDSRPLRRELGSLSVAIGDARRELGQLALALSQYERAMGVFSYLSSCDPGNAAWQRDLIVSHWELAELAEQTPARGAKAADHWSQALAIARTLADTGRLAPTDAYFVETLEDRLAAAQASSATSH